MTIEHGADQLEQACEALFRVHAEYYRRTLLHIVVPRGPKPPPPRLPDPQAPETWLDAT